LSLLLDSSVLIDVQRRYKPALAWLARQDQTALFVSSATAFELYAGADRPGAAEAVRQMLDAVSIVVVDAVIAEKGASIFRRYEASHGVDEFDAIIAATALVARLPLVTRNVRHFPAVKNVRKPY
jgi:predicted nucleic acid-binding protein